MMDEATNDTARPLPERLERYKTLTAVARTHDAGIRANHHPKPPCVELGTGRFVSAKVDVHQEFGEKLCLICAPDYGERGVRVLNEMQELWRGFPWLLVMVIRFGQTVKRALG